MKFKVRCASGDGSKLIVEESSCCDKEVYIGIEDETGYYSEVIVKISRLRHLLDEIEAGE